ncbi:MAG: hypothetical protein ACK4GL_07955 [Flavobacteriales bacterium]
MIRNTIILTLAAILLLFASCKKDSSLEPGPWYENYFPLEQGTFITYNCDSLVYNDFTNQVDTFRFLIKQYYESVFLDNAGREAMRLERWKKEHPDSAWFLKDVWFVVKTKDRVEKVEEDVRIVKMVFPVRDNKEWDANALNFLPARTYTYDNIHQPFNVLQSDFDSTVTVVNTDPVNLVNEFRNTEVYAINRGLIYRNFVDVRLRTDTLLSIPWFQRIRSGVVFTMRAQEFGVQ